MMLLSVFAVPVLSSIMTLRMQDKNRGILYDIVDNNVGMIMTYCTGYETLQELKMSVKHVHRPRLICFKGIRLDRTRSGALQLEEAREGDVHVRQKVLGRTRD